MNVLPCILWGKLDGIHRIIQKTAPTDITVLIEGETGTGKRLVAKVIHALSSRRDQPFIPIDCAAITDKQLERGVLSEEAKKGTLFLEEVGDMDLNLQMSLLPALEQSKSRIISATKRDLDQAMMDGRFSRELYYRLCVLKIQLPPLRERKEDIIPFAEHFAAGRVKKISIRAKRLLKSYGWPGNVREMRNCIERALVLGDGRIIQPQDLPYMIRRCGKIIPVPLESLDHMEEEYIVKVLQHTQWNQNEAAQILGIGLQSLEDKIKKYRIQRQEKDKKTLHLYKN